MATEADGTPLAWFDEPDRAFWQHGIGAACWRTWAPLARAAKFGTLPHDPAGGRTRVLLVLLPHDLAGDCLHRLFAAPHPDGPDAGWNGDLERPSFARAFGAVVRGPALRTGPARRRRGMCSGRRRPSCGGWTATPTARGGSAAPVAVPGGQR